MIRMLEHIHTHPEDSCKPDSSSTARVGVTFLNPAYVGNRIYDPLLLGKRLVAVTECIDNLNTKSGLHDL